MTAWRSFRDASPPRDRVFLARCNLSCLPQVATAAPTLPGYRLAFPPFEGGEPGARGLYRDADDLVREGWEWTEIPE